MRCADHALEYRKLADIKPYQKNPRKNDKAVAAVANSIREYGFQSPIIVDKDGVIIAGHTRYKAAKRLQPVTPVCVGSRWILIPLPGTQTRTFPRAKHTRQTASAASGPMKCAAVAMTWKQSPERRA